MNLKQTIDELEEQARQYRKAADTLRALTTTSAPAPATLAQSTTTGGPGAQKSALKAAKKARGKSKGARTVSDETRAKISEKVKAAHAARKAAAASA